MIKHLLSGISLFIFILLFSSSGFALDERMYLYLRNRYNLSGEIQLSYERSWSDDSETQQRFTHSYSLGLQGFVIDSRLVSFNIRGNFLQEIDDPGHTYNLQGLALNIDLFNERIKRGFIKNLPQPIHLRFSHSKGLDSETWNYGISLTYKPVERPIFYGKIKELIQQEQQRQQQRQQQKQKQQKKKTLDEEEEDENTVSEKQEGNTGQGQKGSQLNQGERRNVMNVHEMIRNALPFPTFYLDYDRYNYKFNGSKTDTDRLDLRAESLSPKLDIKAEYTLNRLSYGDNKGTYQDLTVDSLYRYYNEESATRADIYNRALFRDYSNYESFMFDHLTNWSRNIGKDRRDLLNLSGSARYSYLETEQSYDLKASGSYFHYLSTRARDTISAAAGYGYNGSDDVYSIFLSNTLSYDISKMFGISNSLSIGQTELGTSYGAGAGLNINTFINIGTYYDFSSSVLNEGRKDTHRFRLDFSGVLRRNMTFSSRNTYFIINQSGSEPYRQRGYELRGDFYWSFPRFNINIGASQILTRTENKEETETGITSIYSTISSYLSRRLYLSLMSSFSKYKDGVSLLSIHPILNWQIRMVTLTAEYELLKTHGNDKNSTEHRILLRLTRRFERAIRPFFR